MVGPYRKKPQGRHHRSRDGSPRPPRLLPLNNPRASGRHRKPGPLPLTWRTAGGALLGAAVLGTAAATAQASVLPIGAVPTSMAVAESVSGKKDRGGPAGNDSAEDESKRSPKSSAKGSSGTGSKQTGGSEQDGGPKPGGEPAKEQPAEDRRPTAEEAINVAKSQVGISEDRGGRTKFQEWYVNSPRAKETVARDGGHVNAYQAAPWCDMFVSWVGEQIGFTDQIGSDAWTVTHARWFEQQGRWGTEPKPGAIAFFSWRGGKRISDIVHVGMVIKKVDDNTVQTVEGNTENAVKIKNRSVGTIVGYGYPDYKS